MRRIVTVLLLCGVVFGFGSGFASVARHARMGCHQRNGGPPPWSRWDRERLDDREAKAAPAPAAAPVVAPPQTVVVQPQQAAPAPAPIIVVVPVGQAAVLPTSPAVAPAPVAVAPAPPPTTAP